MRPINFERSITPSLFDRLTDHQPGLKNDLPATAREGMTEFKESVARDLMDLLNVRRGGSDVPPAFEETARSIAAFGVTDFSSSPVDIEQIRRAIEAAVRAFEPRLSHVVVQKVERSAHDRVEFRISGVLHAGLHTEPVLFDAALTKHSRRLHVSEGR